MAPRAILPKLVTSLSACAVKFPYGKAILRALDAVRWKHPADQAKIGPCDATAFGLWHVTQCEFMVTLVRKREDKVSL